MRQLTARQIVDIMKDALKAELHLGLFSDLVLNSNSDLIEKRPINAQGEIVARCATWREVLELLSQ